MTRILFKERKKNNMTDWTTIEDLKKQLIDCLKYDIETNNITGDFQNNQYLIKQLDEHIDQSLIYNIDQYKLIEYYGHWNIQNNDKTLTQIFDCAIEELIAAIWKELIKQ